MMPCILLALPNPALHSWRSTGGGKTYRRSARAEWVRPDHSGIWLRNAAAGLCLLAAAAAVVSFTAQYRLVYATRRLAVVAGLEAAIPDAAALVFACLGIALALHGRRAVRARFLNLASVGTSVFMNKIAAAPGWRNLAMSVHAAHRLRPGQRHTNRGWSRPAAIAHQQDLNIYLAPEEATPLAVAGGLVLWLLRLALAPVSPAGRVPRLGRGAVPGRPRPPPGPRAPAGVLAAPGRGPAAGQDGPLPDLGDRTAWVFRLDPARPGRRDRRGPGPPGRPERRLRPGGLAQGRPGGPERRPPMMIKYAIALAVVLIVAAFAVVGVPARPVPARQPRPLPAGPAAPAAASRQGLRPPFQPVAALGPPGCAAPLGPDPPSLPLRYRLLDSREHAVFLGRAHYPHTCGSRWRSTCW